MASRRLEVAPARAHRLRERYADVRAATAGLAAPLSAEDQLVQSMPDASPTKWHLAHTTWFFETFVLSKFVPGYRVVDEKYAYLFNSYYEAVGPRQPRPRRGAMTRPSLDEVRAYRDAVDERMDTFLDAPPAGGEALDRIELGLHHEQQHQELILTDIHHALWSNPLRPAYRPDGRPATPRSATPGPSSRSTTRGRAIACSWSRSRWRGARSPPVNTSASWKTAVTAGRTCGSRTAGPRCRSTAGRRRSTGTTGPTAGASSRCWARSRSASTRP